MRIWDVLALVAIVVVAIVGSLYRNSANIGDIGTPRRPDPGRFQPAPPPPPPPPAAEAPPDIVDPRVVTIMTKPKEKSSRGTAFAITGSGVWVTARHVTDGCDRVVLRTGNRFVRVRRIQQERNADISVLWTRLTVSPLRIIQPTLRTGQEGFSFGFPKGNPGDVHGRIIGQRTIRHVGYRSSSEPAVAWTQLRRVPDIGADLRGISGGPWVDSSGGVIGVHVAGSPRRGRSYSTAPRTLLAAIRRAGAPAARSPGSAAVITPTPTNFPEVGNRLRQQLTVSQVLCLVGDRWR